MASAPTEIDESLYSRQLYVLGHEAQRRMAQSNVLIAGLNGLGVEVAKNVILAGVRSVTLFDSKNTHWNDLAAQFYLTEADIGKNRAERSVAQLAELNPYVSVSLSPAGDVLSAITTAAQPFRVVVLVDQSLAVQRAVCAYCHQHGIAAIVADTRGVFGQVFCDFGDAFVVSDADGEPVTPSMVASVSNDVRALVTVLEETRHGLSDGDVVRLTEIEGLQSQGEAANGSNTTDNVLNGREFAVTVKDAFSFEIDLDTRALSRHARGGYATPVKQPLTLSFQPFENAFFAPGDIVSDFSKSDRVLLLHITFRALSLFAEERNGSMPRPGNDQDAQRVVELVREVNAEMALRSGTAPGGVSLCERELREGEAFIRSVSHCAAGVVSPLCAVLGGVAGQEALKACSGKFLPVRQWFYCDALEALPENVLDERERSPRNCRYDAQIAVFGCTLQKRLSALRVFLVGAGAIGCEMLKNWALMGVAAPFEDTLEREGEKESVVGNATEMRRESAGKTSEKCRNIAGISVGKPSEIGRPGAIVVTDNDHIEKSNLSRQFLFRNTDIDRPKSTTAVAAVRRMNPAINAFSHELKVGSETENVFNDEFYEDLHMICTALDNVEARLYLDQKSLFYGRAMLESGTLGAKGHTQLVAPGLTESYGATRDPPEASIPVCTLKHFPHSVEHTLQWAREFFAESVTQPVMEIESYLRNAEEFLVQMDKQPNVKYETLRRLRESVLTQRPYTIEDCVVYARRLFEELFANRVKQLLHNFPLDRVTSSGALFWSGAKKPPTPLEFSSSDPLHREFVLSVASMRAHVYGLTERDLCVSLSLDEQNALLRVAENAVVDAFVPLDGLKIAASDEELKSESAQNALPSAAAAASASPADIDALCESIMRELPTPQALLHTQDTHTSTQSPLTVRCVEFDKDVDAHMRVVASASNLRARNYRIPEADMHKSRGIAGKITPAIATTTAVVTGLICLELIKLLQDDKPVEKLANSFVNLGALVFTSMTPEPPKSVTSIVKGKEWKWTPWDRIDINQPEMTVKELIAYLEDEFALELSMLSSGVTILFSDFMDRKKKMERQNMSLRKLVETVTKKEIPASQKFLVFEIIVTDPETGDEVEVPYVRFRL